MKIQSIFKCLIVAVFTLSSITTVRAVEDLRIIPSNAEKSLALYLDNVSTQSVSVNIIDRSGIIVFGSEKKVAKRFSQKYNLENLPNGDYTLRVATFTRIIEQPITINNSGVTMNQQEEKIIFKPMIKMNGQYLEINHLADYKTVTLKILNDSNQKIYSTSIDNQLKIHKSFNLSKLEKGKYSLVYRVDGKTFYESIML